MVVKKSSSVLSMCVHKYTYLKVCLVAS